ncbi:MAG TPA: DUF6364 family protein [Phycisphaerales bacterium]|nr:DUF6364 family protein [Phycisphaerales bacterium]
MEKLTLSMSKEDVRTAKRLARERGTSLSAMFARFVRVLDLRGRGPKTDELPPITRKMTGTISLPMGKTDRELVEDALMAKHGFKR